MTQLFVGDSGTEIIMNCGVNVSNAVIRKIVVMKPDKTKVEWNAVAGPTISTIQYFTQPGDIDMDGTWKIQAYIETLTWKGHGEIVLVTVSESLSALS